MKAIQLYTLVDYRKTSAQVGKMADLKGEARKELLDRVVSTIQVKTTGTRSHLLTIKFNLPYYGDRFEYVGPKKTSKHSQIIPGKDTVEVPFTDAKKKS